MSKIIKIDNDGRVSSKQVAESFGKDHDKVLKAIKRVLNGDSRGLAHFGETYFIDKWNRKQPAYNITKDGFMFIALSFTGEKFDKLKWDFIQAFNAYEISTKVSAEYIANLQEAFLATHPRARAILELKKLGYTNGEIGTMLGKGRTTISDNISKLRRVGLLEKAPVPQNFLTNKARG